MVGKSQNCLECGWQQISSLERERDHQVTLIRALAEPASLREDVQHHAFDEIPPFDHALAESDEKSLPPCHSKILAVSAALRHLFGCVPPGWKE